MASNQLTIVNSNNSSHGGLKQRHCGQQYINVLHAAYVQMDPRLKNVEHSIVVIPTALSVTTSSTNFFLRSTGYCSALVYSLCYVLVLASASGKAINQQSEIPLPNQSIASHPSRPLHCTVNPPQWHYKFLQAKIQDSWDRSHCCSWTPQGEHCQCTTTVAYGGVG